MFSESKEVVHKGFLARIIGAVALLSIAYIMIIMTPEDYRISLQSEINAFKTFVGPSDSESVMESSKSMYYSAFIKTNVISGMESSIADYGFKGTEFLKNPLIRIIENLKLMFYQTTFRIAVFIHWLALGFPLIIALSADGYYQRKKKQYEFGVSSTNLYKIWIKAGVFAFFIIDVYFIFPAAGQMGVVLPPLMFLLLGYSLRYTISNVSKVF